MAGGSWRDVAGWRGLEARPEVSPGPAGLGRQVGTQPRTRGVCRPLHAPTLVREGGAEGRWGRTPGLGRGQLATHAAESVTVSSHAGQQMFSVRRKGRQPPAGEKLVRETNSPESRGAR